MEKVSKILENMRARTGGPQTTRGWKEMLPPGSNWNPGDPGDPACTICNGTGFVRLDLPINHPQFGRIHFCDCVTEQRLARIRNK